jgi:hypothetical protein
MGLRGRDGVRLGQGAPRDQFFCHRVVPGQARRATARSGRQPVSAAVAEPAHGDRITRDHGGDVRGRRRLPRRAQAGQGLVRRAHRGARCLRRVIAAPSRRQQYPDRGLRGGQRRLVRAGRAGHPVADDGDRHLTAGTPGGREGHRVLVARVPQAPVGDAGQQPEVKLGMVAAGGHLAAARLAVTLGADRAGRDRRVHGAYRTLRPVPGGRGADDGRGEFRAAGLAEAVGGTDGLTAGRAGTARLGWPARHVRVLGRIALAMSTSSIRRASSGVSRASAR